MTDYTELKRLAEHAFNGPWTFTEIDPDDKSWGACELQNKDGAFIATHVCGAFNASYIAAASPDVVLGMIAEIDRLKLHIKHIGNDALRTQNQALTKRLEDADYLVRAFENGCDASEYARDIYDYREAQTEGKDV